MATKRPARASPELREAPLSPRYHPELHHQMGHCYMFARRLRKHGITVTGFDSLKGLSEDWLGNHNGREAGAYTVHGKAPELEPNAELRDGWVQDTLPGFLDEHPDETVALAHLDFDTYTPTAYALERIRPRLVPGSILLFDEL